MVFSIAELLPRVPSDACRIFNLTGSSSALLLALQKAPFIAVEQDESKAGLLSKDIAFYRRLLGGDEVLFLPDTEGAAEAGARAKALYSLDSSGSLVTSSANLRSSLWAKELLSDYTITLRPGIELSRTRFEERLIELGYRPVSMVSEEGEFSRREWIFDVYPSTDENPIRIEFFGDEIETVRYFDVESQRSNGEVNEFILFPADESPLTFSLPEVAPGRRFFFLYPEEDLSLAGSDPVLFSRLSMESYAKEENKEDLSSGIIQIDAGVLSARGQGILPDERKGIEALAERIGRLSRQNRVIIIASSKAQSVRLRELLRDVDVIAPVIGTEEIGSFGGHLSISVGDLSAGLVLKGLYILTERELFGERPAFRPMKKSRVANLLQSIDDITPGDHIVHREHGIGTFAGISKQSIGDTSVELMVLEYEDGRLYLPVYAIRNISKYRAEESVKPRIDRLGGKTWEKKKERVRKKVHAMAERLLRLYAGRKVARGFAFSQDAELHREFADFFAYEETEDQIKAIEDIRKDMESDMPMDRLLCGDVGYGKTEVAMRAAFKAVFDGRQVAVLVPTTILAEQHFRTFRDRFSGFPVTIDHISRFREKKEIDLSIKALAQGQTDIIIGTHALLSKKVVFSRLGLLIIDEEHRFGVGQKEKMKELAKNIDVLTLTATPIPRTLHMSLSGIRNISVIETPPEERLAVRSVVTVFNEDLIRNAITAELRRNGQVYFVHNRIQDIHKFATRLEDLAPSARIAVAHGQMAERDLEKIMLRFFNADIDVLVSTAIVGSGLDVPRANTIFINMADRMGLADLYQLRGRVGRSSIRGHAYFITPPEHAMTEEAKKRLQAVQEMSYLGAGFRLALRDLEIRGAGDIFGGEQSGHINEIGFDLYIEILEQTIAELQGTEIREEREPAIDLKISALIPERYIDETTLRLSFYRRMASLKNIKDVMDLESELRDRFGPMPEEVSNLLSVMKLKVPARELCVINIKEVKDRIQVLFTPDTPVKPEHMFGLHAEGRYSLKFLPDGFELSASKVPKHKWIDHVYQALTALADRVSESAAASAGRD